MRAFVYGDRALERHAGRFVWLSVDTEKEQNADFLVKYPIRAYPTLLVVDPGRERPVLTWVGGASVQQIEDLLDGADRAMRGKGRGPDARLIQGDGLLGAGNPKAASEAYRKALAREKPGWPQHDRAVESLLTALSLDGADADCVAVAKDQLPDEIDRHFAAVALSGLGCALSLEGQAADAAIATFEPAVRSAIDTEGIDWSADDRSGALQFVMLARKAAGDEPGARAGAQEWLEFLETEAGRAPTPEARAVFDSHRVSAAIAAGEPERALPALERSERDFPEDYNPPARLAYTLLQAKRYDDALAASDRALLLVYGPRRLSVLSTRSDILAAKGDVPGARAVLEEAVRYAESLPPSQVSPERIAALRKRVAAL